MKYLSESLSVEVEIPEPKYRTESFNDRIPNRNKLNYNK